MSSQKIINICLKPRKAFVLAVVSCGIILSLFLWKFYNPDKFINNGDLPALAAIFFIGVYLNIKLSSYRLLLYDDRIIKELWWQKKEILYRDIKKIIITPSCFDAYQIGKAINPQAFKKLEKYQIFDVWIISSKCNIHFRTKWFDSIRQINDALLLLIEKCPIDKLQRNQHTNFFIMRDIKMIIKWIIVFFILTYIASFFF